MADKDIRTDPAMQLQFEQLAFEREKARQQHELEKLKVKWISGVVAVILAIVGAIGGWATGVFEFLIKKTGVENETALNEKQIEKDYLDSYVKYALDKDLRTRRDFALYVSTTARTEDVRNNWKSFKQAIEALIGQEQIEKEGKFARLAELEVAGQSETTEANLLRQEVGLITSRDLGSSGPAAASFGECIDEVGDAQPVVNDALLQAARQAGSESWMKFAIGELGVSELPGPKCNARIGQYLKSANWAGPASDETPWSGAFVNWVFISAEIGELASDPMRNDSWLDWGEAIEEPRFGALAFVRRGENSRLSSGHLVGFYVGETGETVQILGGNIANSVKISAFDKERVVGYRMPPGYASR